MQLDTHLGKMLSEKSCDLKPVNFILWVFQWPCLHQQTCNVGATETCLFLKSTFITLRIIADGITDVSFFIEDSKIRTILSRNYYKSVFMKPKLRYLP